MRYLITLLFFIQIVDNTLCQNPVADFEVNIHYMCGYATTEFKNNSINADTFLWDIYGTGYYYQTFEPRGLNWGNNKRWIVTLIAKGQGLSDTLSKEVEVLNTKIKFNYSIADTNLFAPLEVNFINLAIIRQGDTLTYDWDFGDGQQSIETNPQHTYNVPGTYYIDLTALKNDSCELLYHDFVTVRDTAQKGEFEYIISKCSTKPCDLTQQHLLESYSFILNQIINRNDSIILSGFIRQNCCTDKTVTLKQRNDTVFIQTWETGPECTCGDDYYFEIVLPQIEDSTITISFNNEIATAFLTNINELNLYNSEIKVFPNPANRILTLEFPENNYNDYEYFIVDAKGMIIQKGTLQGKYEINLNFPDIGLFFIHFKNVTDHKEYISKFIKN